MTLFERKVLTVVSRIPVGRVTTYGDVARLAGRPARLEPWATSCARPGDLACLPRVIAATGSLAVFHLSLKRSLRRLRPHRGPGG